VNKKFIIPFIILILLIIAGGVFWWWQGQRETSPGTEFTNYENCLQQCGEKFGAVGLPARMKCNSECDRKYLK